MSNKHPENGNHSDGTVTDAVAAAAEGFDPKMHAKIATKADSHHRQPLRSSSDAGIPVDDFPLRCLECVLDEATGYYHQKMRRLKLLTIVAVRETPTVSGHCASSGVNSIARSRAASASSAAIASEQKPMPEPSTGASRRPRRRKEKHECLPYGTSAGLFGG